MPLRVGASIPLLSAASPVLSGLRRERRTAVVLGRSGVPSASNAASRANASCAHSSANASVVERYARTCRLRCFRLDQAVAIARHGPPRERAAYETQLVVERCIDAAVVGDSRIGLPRERVARRAQRRSRGVLMLRRNR